MKRFPFSPILLISFVFFSLSGFSQSTDFPGWRGANRDGKVIGFKAPDVWPKELTKVWEVTVGLGDASPSLVNNRIYLITSLDSIETLICMDAKSGKLIWKTPINHAPKVTGGAASHPGPRSTPGISYGKVFTVGAGGVVACHDAKKGKLIWKVEDYTKEVPQFFTSASPLLTETLCILPLGGKENGVVVAFDVNTGKEVWKVSGYPCTYSSPVFFSMGDPVIVHQSETSLVGIFLNGQVVGDIPTPPAQRFYNSSTPVIDGTDIYVAGAGTGTHKFSVDLQAGAQEVWNNPALNVSFCTPVLKDGFLYANDAKFGYIYCLNAESGETAWSDTTKLNRFASMVDLGSTMMTLAGNATLIFFEPNGKNYNQLARYKVSDTEVYAHPLVLGDKVYVKDKEKLTCWVVR